MIGYQTQQRNTLLAFFQAHPDQSFTVDEVTALVAGPSGGECAFPQHRLPHRSGIGSGTGPQTLLSGRQAQKRLPVPRSAGLRRSPAHAVRGVQHRGPFGPGRFPPLWRSFCMSHQTYFWIWAIPRWWAAAKNAVTLFNTPKGGGIYAQSQAVGGRALRAVCRCPDGVRPVCCHACTASLHRGPLPRMRGTVCLHGTVAPGCCFCSSLVRCLRSPACCPLAAACDAF